ncbi:sortase [Patescibacteria group bacterium]|nr:sortase [Patescibacteria group bacterium]
MKHQGTIYEFGGDRWGFTYIPGKNLTVITPLPARKSRSHGSRTLLRSVGIAVVAFALGGMFGPLTPELRLETMYQAQQAYFAIRSYVSPAAALPPSAPVIFDPLVGPDGREIKPVNTDFSIIIPKIGVNAAVIPAVNPANSAQYDQALLHGVAHASTSFFPDQNGTVYLFSHSTNYDWFVKDLNAVFYLIKNLQKGDLIVLIYKGKEYTYRLREERIVAANDVSYLTGQPGDRSLILQTCWPPGSTAERLLLFADPVEGQSGSI